MKKALFAAFAAASLVSFGVSGQGSASASTRVGSVNVEAWCEGNYSYHAYVKSWSAFGWKCNPVPNNSYYKSLDRDVDMNSACKVYGPSAFAAYSDVSNPYSWACYV